MISGWRIVESTELYAGLAVQLIDDHTGSPIGTSAEVFVDVEEGPGWRALDLAPEVLPGAAFLFPRLERYADARNKPPRNYRVRARSDYYWSLSRITGADVIVPVAPFDDVTAPAWMLTRPEPLRMIPRPAAPVGLVPMFRGRVQTGAPATPVPDAIVFYDQPQPVGPPRQIQVLSEADGDYALPVRHISTAALTLRVTSGGVTVPFPFPAWRTAAGITQNLTL